MRSNQNYLNKNLGREVKDLLVKALEFFPNGNPKHAIDLGCGLGIETKYLLQQPGWTVLAIDGDTELLALAEQQNAQHDRVKFLNTSFEDIKSLPACDLLYSYHSMHFIDKNHNERMWNLITTAVKPGGIIALSLFGPEDSMVSKKHAIGISEQDLRDKLRPFKIVHFNSVRKNLRK